MYKVNFISYWLILDIITFYLIYLYFKFIYNNKKTLFKSFKKFNFNLILLLIIILIIIAFFIYKTRNHNIRNFIRNNDLHFNHNPNFNHHPKTQNDLINILKKHKNVNVVGSCWSSFLNKKGKNNSIYTNNLNKKVHETPNTITYESGSLITNIQNDLIKSNKTLCEFPSLEWITIGGWLNPGCHGHPGSIKKQLFKTCKLYDKKNDSIFNVEFNNSFNYFGNNNYILLEVEFIKYDNIVVKNDSFILKNIEDCEKWLSNNTTGRLIFCGKRGSIGKIWYETNETNETKLLNSNDNNIDKYNSKLYNQWYDGDIESWISSNIVNINIENSINKLRKNYNYQTLARSNQTVPGFLPEMSCLALGLNIYNFEIFTNIDCNSIFLNKLLKELENFHSTIGGRTEIRLREPNILMIDWSVQSYNEIKKAFNLLYKLGIINIYIHKGKYIPLNVEPCNLIEYYKLFK